MEGYVWNVKDWLNFEIIEVEEFSLKNSYSFRVDGSIKMINLFKLRYFY